MQTHKFLTDIGLARRAGTVCFGFDEVRKQAELGNAKTVFITSDASPNTVKRASRICEAANVSLRKVNFTMYDVGNAAGRKPTAVFAATDKGFDALLHKSLETNGGNA